MLIECSYRQCLCSLSVHTGSVYARWVSTLPQWRSLRLEIQNDSLQSLFVSSKLHHSIPTSLASWLLFPLVVVVVVVLVPARVSWGLPSAQRSWLTDLQPGMIIFILLPSWSLPPPFSLITSASHSPLRSFLLLHIFQMNSTLTMSSTTGSWLPVTHTLVFIRIYILHLTLSIWNNNAIS